MRENGAGGSAARRRRTAGHRHQFLRKLGAPVTGFLYARRSGVGRFSGLPLLLKMALRREARTGKHRRIPLAPPAGTA